MLQSKESFEWGKFLHKQQSLLDLSDFREINTILSR